jgi:uncharacterized protein YjiS (DUF1127 family)
MAHTIDTKLGAAAGASSRTFGAVAATRRIGVNILNKLVIWQERAEQRHALRALDSRMLKDIGISAADAQREAGKPFWLA